MSKIIINGAMRHITLYNIGNDNLNEYMLPLSEYLLKVLKDPTEKGFTANICFTL